MAQRRVRVRVGVRLGYLRPSLLGQREALRSVRVRVRVPASIPVGAEDGSEKG